MVAPCLLYPVLKAPLPVNPDKAYNFSKMSLLLVDGSNFMRSTIRQMCRTFGFAEILEASDGSEALELMRHSHVDVILCDWMTEPLDGFDFTRLIRTAADSPDPFVPVIMLTSRTEKENVTRARDVGVTEFLAKPLSAQTLLSRLVYVCEHPRTFVRCPGYFGPDRRRKTDDKFKGPDRRTGNTVALDDEGSQDQPLAIGWGLSEEEMAAILAEDQ